MQNIHACNANITVRTLASIAITIWLFMSCESVFEPFANTYSEISVFGYLEANADTQWVRVIPGRHRLERPADYVGHGISLLLRGNIEIEFRDTILTARDGNKALLFYTVDSIGPSTQWELMVIGANYNPVHARIDIPALIPPQEVIFDAPYFTSDGYSQSFFFTNRIDYFFIEACYWISIQQNDLPFKACSRLSDGRHISVRPNGILVSLYHTNDRAALLRSNGLSPEMPYYLHAAGIRVVVASDDWLTSDGMWDPETAVIPGIYSNTSNGLGFIGGVSISEVKWIPTSSDFNTVEEMGFMYKARN